MATNAREIQLFTYRPSNGLLDELNLTILRHLQHDPRLTLAELGRRVGLSSPAVSERVKRLEEAGVIKGYSIEVDPTALGLPLCAYVRVRPNAGQLTRIAELAREIPEVVECHRITGEDCFILKVCLPAMDQLDRLLDRFLVYGTTTTSIVQSSPVPPRPLPIPAIGDRSTSAPG